MIETEQSVTIAAPIDEIWAQACDIARWAELMPGYRECEVIDGDNSRWVLKVGVGALLRTVTVLVHVDRWDGPGTVAFSYQLEGDPVEGDGTYQATAAGTELTDIVLTVRVRGGGPMAPMWEAMGRPLLPKLARSFAEQLRDRIEQAHHPVTDDVPEPQSSGKLGKLWRKIGASSGC